MKLIVKLTNQAALRSGEDTEENQYTFDCEPGDLPGDVREQIANRLYEEAYLCVAVLNKNDAVEPSVSNGGPDLLLVDGTDLKALIQAVREDQEEVERCLSEVAKQKSVASTRQ
jgi:hypothetical protein